MDNAPPVLGTATPARDGLFARTYGSDRPRRTQDTESNITDRRRAVGHDAYPASPSEEQQLLQPQISAAAAKQRRVTFRMETEIAELDARKAAAEATLAQSHQRTHALERASAGSGAPKLPSLSPPHERRSTRRSPSRHSCNFSTTTSSKQLPRNNTARNTARNNAERIDMRLQSGRKRLEAHLLRTPPTAPVGYRIGAAAKEFRPFEGNPHPFPTVAASEGESGRYKNVSPCGASTKASYMET